MQETWVQSPESSTDRGAWLQSMAGCSPWGHKELDTTELVNTNTRTSRKECSPGNTLTSALCQIPDLQNYKMIHVH